MSQPQEMPQPQQRGWWGRNWKWVVPVGCLGPLVVCAGGLTLLVTLVFGILKSSEPYKEAVARAKASTEVRDALGEPLREGTFPSGSVNTRNDNGVQSGEAHLSIPISGPKGSATIRVEARKEGAKWSYSTLQVQVPGRERPIALAAGPPG